MARANHSCMSNVEHQFVQRQGVKRLNSCRDIEAGEELSSVLPKPPIYYCHRSSLSPDLLTSTCAA